MAKFTIGIPTYNRAGFLRRAIESALNQTYPDVEVLVSDNASTDETQEIARSFGDRIRYHRNAENLGMWRNFALLPELATGDYFSWLQDDDLIHCDFARRAVKALSRPDDVTVYIASNISTDSVTTFYSAFLYGPLVALGWMGDEPRIVDGILLTPLSLFRTNGMPPALAFRIGTARRAMGSLLPDCLLYNERIILAAAAAEGNVAIDPWAGGIFYLHPNQGFRQENDQAEVRWSQWRLMVKTLCINLEKRGRSWEEPFRRLIEESDVEFRRRWIDGQSCPIEIDQWRNAHPLAEEIRNMVVGPFMEPVAFSPSPSQLLKKGLKQWTPPLLWSALKGTKSALKMNPH